LLEKILLCGRKIWNIKDFIKIFEDIIPKIAPKIILTNQLKKPIR